MDLKTLFDSWAQRADGSYADRQWLLSKWEVVEGIRWPDEKIAEMVHSIVEGLNLKTTDTLFDLGCGGGWILKALAPYAKKGVGVDFSLEMLLNAAKLSPAQTFVCGEIGKLPLKDNSCECVLSYFVFINFMDDILVHDAILDIMRILKKDGRALLGQFPDKNKCSDYDEAKRAYLEDCRGIYEFGKDYRDICNIPIKLFDKDQLIEFLNRENIPHHIRNSFNPFYRPGQPKTVDWRFDLILEKK